VEEGLNAINERLCEIRIGKVLYIIQDGGLERAHQLNLGKGVQVIVKGVNDVVDVVHQATLAHVGCIRRPAVRGKDNAVGAVHTRILVDTQRIVALVGLVNKVNREGHLLLILYSKAVFKSACSRRRRSWAVLGLFHPLQAGCSNPHNFHCLHFHLPGQRNPGADLRQSPHLVQ